MAIERSVADARARQENEKSIPPRIRIRPSEKVVGGDILWKPVDRVAARLLCKSPWWSLPPAIASNPKESQEKPQIKKERMKTSFRADEGPVQGGGHINDPKQSSEKPPEVFNAELASHFYKRADKAISETDKLVSRTMDARAALEVMCQHWKKDWFQFTEDSDSRLQWLRQSRMAFDTETRILMAQLRDVRQFLMDPQHETEVKRLREFIELCERLDALKKSGFLDTVADTILNLSVKP